MEIAFCGAPDSIPAEHPGEVAEPVGGNGHGAEVVAVDVAVEHGFLHEAAEFRGANSVEVIRGGVMQSGDCKCCGGEDGAFAAEFGEGVIAAADVVHIGIESLAIQGEEAFGFGQGEGAAGDEVVDCAASLGFAVLW